MAALAWDAFPPAYAQFAPPAVYARDRADSKEMDAERPATATLRQQVDDRLSQLERHGEDLGCSTLAQPYCHVDTCKESAGALREYRNSREGAALSLAQLYPGKSRMHTTCIGWMMDWPRVDGPVARDIHETLLREARSGSASAVETGTATGRTQTEAHPAAQGTLRQKLLELQEAREAGLLSNEEFEALRQDVLKRF